MNVLLTSVGRRAYMVKYFKDILKDGGKVFVCNSDSNSVAFHYADAYAVSPLIYDESYVPFLLSFCKENSIDMLIPLFDIDLPVIAENKNRFAEIGTKAIVSDASFVKICNDKWKSYVFLGANGFFVPKTFIDIEDAKKALDTGEISYPLVVKPRFGCGSLSVFKADDEDDLFFFYNKVKKEIKKSYLKYESASFDEIVIIQEFVKGQEYGADLINDLESNFVNAVIKKKIAMRSGETDIAETVGNAVIRETAECLARKTGHIANLDVDIILKDGIPYILEMNARFGGGYPFSHLAGCDLPYALTEWVKGNKVDPGILTAKTGVRGFKEIDITAF